MTKTDQEIEARDALLRLRDKTRRTLGEVAAALGNEASIVRDMALGSFPDDTRTSLRVVIDLASAYAAVQILNGQLTGIRDALEVTR